MPETRTAPRRGRTRQALMDAALELVTSKGSFSALSLRQVARRAGVVPTAFYRHFADMDALGLALVDESFRTLRRLMREVRSSGLPTEQVIRGSVETYIHYVRANRLHFRFVIKERFSGSVVTRTAIRQEIRLFTSELATDLSRFPVFNNISAEDLQMIAALVVNNMIAITEEALETGDDDEEAVNHMLKTAEKQIRLIFLGIGHWRSK